MVARQHERRGRLARRHHGGEDPGHRAAPLANGGYILAPCHNLQSVSPVENIVAMYETGYEEGFLTQ